MIGLTGGSNELDSNNDGKTSIKFTLPKVNSFKTKAIRKASGLSPYNKAHLD